MARADHLHVWRQGDAVKHPRLNPRIVGGKEYMTGNGNARHQGSSTALAVVVERIPKTALGRCVVFIELIERELCWELDAWQVRKAAVSVGHLGAQEPGEVSVI
jgi:hypothetical protein